MITPDTSAALPFQEHASALERIGSGARKLGRFFVQKKLGGLGLVVVVWALGTLTN